MPDSAVLNQMILTSPKRESYILAVLIQRFIPGEQDPANCEANRKKWRCLSPVCEAMVATISVLQGLSIPKRTRGENFDNKS